LLMRVMLKLIGNIGDCGLGIADCGFLIEKFLQI